MIVDQSANSGTYFSALSDESEALSFSALLEKSTQGNSWQSGEAKSETHCRVRPACCVEAMLWKGTIALRPNHIPWDSKPGPVPLGLCAQELLGEQHSVQVLFSVSHKKRISILAGCRSGNGPAPPGRGFARAFPRAAGGTPPGSAAGWTPLAGGVAAGAGVHRPTGRTASAGGGGAPPGPTKTPRGASRFRQGVEGPPGLDLRVRFPPCGNSF